jgi:hypothetical protein
MSAARFWNPRYYGPLIAAICVAGGVFLAAICAAGGVFLAAWHNDRKLDWGETIPRVEASSQGTDSAWEKPVPPGHETDITLLFGLQFGKEAAEFMEKDKMLRGARIGIKRYVPQLPPRKDTPLYLAYAAWDEHDMLFYLLRDKGQYYLLTDRNLARMYQPIETPGEALRYVKFHYNLLVDRFADVLTKEDKKNWPDLSEFTTAKSLPLWGSLHRGFDVHLVYNHYLNFSYVNSVRVFVRPDGIIVPQSGSERRLKDLGGGIYF